jgi:hypothetical protein
VGNISGDTDHNWVTHRNRRVEIPKRTTDLKHPVGKFGPPMGAIGKPGDDELP